MEKNNKINFLEYLLDKMVESFKASSKDRYEVVRRSEISNIYYEIELLDIAYAGIVSRIQDEENIVEFAEEIKLKTILANADIRFFVENYFYKYPNYVNYILNLEVTRTAVVLILEEQTSKLNMPKKC